METNRISGLKTSRIQNASFLAALEQPSKRGGAYKKQLLLIGNPVEATREFPGLAHAAQEMNTVAKRFAPSSEAIYAQANATPEAYDSSNPGHNISTLCYPRHGQRSHASGLSHYPLAGERRLQTLCPRHYQDEDSSRTRNHFILLRRRHKAIFRRRLVGCHGLFCEREPTA